MNIGHKAYVFWVSYQYQWWVSSALEITETNFQFVSSDQPQP